MKRNFWIKREGGRGAGNFEYGQGPKRDNSRRREGEDRRPGSRFFAGSSRTLIWMFSAIRDFVNTKKK